MTKAEEAKHLIESKHITLPGVNNVIQIRWADGEDQRLGVDETTIPKLFVGSIPRQAQEENLKDVFSQFGLIEELVLMKDQDGSPKGCAFIKFKLKEDALIAVRFLNGNVFLMGSDKPIEVRFAETNKKKPATAEVRTTQVMPNFMTPQINSNPALNPMINLPYYKYTTQDGVPYYLNPHTRSTQWEEPPPGSLVYPEPPFEPYIVKPLNQFQQKPGGTASPTAETKKAGPSGSNLFIFHLPNEWRDDDLMFYFKDFGNIMSCRIMTDRQTGRSRGFGFISYDNHQSALTAIEKMNGYSVGNKKLKVQLKKGDGDEENFTSSGSSGGNKYTPF